MFSVGPIPTDDKIHDRVAHIVNRKNCDFERVNIQVKNCKEGKNTFRVYNLKRTPGCPMAYCFG